MIATLLGLTAALGPAATGGGPGHRPPAATICQSCGVDGRASLPLIAQLQGHPRWQARDDAAHALRRFDWRAHPEVVLALCDALMMDPKDDVREEAAESLKAMAPCVPEVHATLRQAAARDRDDDVREEAREALGALRRKRCIADCGACGPAPDGLVVPPAWSPLIDPMPGPPATELPAIELPPALPEPQPSRGPGLEPIPEGPVGSRGVVRRVR